MDRSTKKDTPSKRALLFNALRVFLALAIAFFLCQIQLDYIESYTYDMRVRMRPAPNTSGFIQTVTIDNKTQESLKRMPEALDYVKFFDELAKAQPKAVVYVADFSDIIGSYEDLEALATTTKSLNFIVANDSRLPDKGLEEEFQLLPPLQEIKVESAPKTADAQSFAKDGVTRRMVLTLEDQLLLHPRLAALYNNKKSVHEYQGSFQFKRTAQAYIDFRPTGTYKPVSFIDIANGEFDQAQFKDKIIIIGRDTRAEVSDYVMTPYSRDNTAMSRVELHANILDTLILNTAPIPSPWWLNVLATSLIAVLTVFVVLALRPLQGLIILGLTVFSYFAVCLLFFMMTDFWLDMAHPLLAIFICYYFFIPYRLIVENRRSWEYYQRNRLLTQVEELKSNFLRMMSHDLKTPIARIQGMTEMALRDQESLSASQAEALRNISSSSDELAHFVSSILNLGRIESKDIKLHLRSKDINALLLEVIKKSEYLARQKNISIMTEFEPMFSVKVDEDLLRQVFTNLIENAIKYSPENSSIMISTEEVDGKIQVQVADQGIGIAIDDIGNLFTKFYRAKAIRDSEVKGSGLGLYLARYFVDLHKGQISVESAPAQGSTFTVELPMNLN
ncbi:MAG: CHASE2 domain-containing protein [Bdellovibrionota bacterium]